MKITRENYESFFLDYLEGNLEEKNVDQFLDFLEQNPDLKEELHLFENVSLPEMPIVFGDKKQLYKGEADEKLVLENKMIACMEGELENNEQQLFQEYLGRNPELEKEYKLYTKTRLIPDLLIKYPAKKNLYKKSGLTIVMNWIARAAAVVFLLWGINALYQNDNQVQLQQKNLELAKLPTKTIPVPDEINLDKSITTAENHQKNMALQESKSTSPKSIKIQSLHRTEEQQLDQTIYPERDQISMNKISPLLAQLDVEPVENKLEEFKTIDILNIENSSNTLSVEQYIASRAKRVGNEGLLSAQRIARMGLNLASEISGERIGYSIQDGKIASLEFETKLLAFSIPLEKTK